MSYGIHKLMGGGYFRMKPNLCPHCAHRCTLKDGWDFCGPRHKRLSNPHTVSGKCESFTAAAERNDALEADLVKEALAHRAAVAESKAVKA